MGDLTRDPPSEIIAGGTIGTDLMTTASTFAHTGIGAYLDGNPPVFLLHAGAAIELACKALLAAVHPALIVRDNSFPSLLAAIGHSHPTAPSRLGVKTITGALAFDRCAHLHPHLTPARRDAQSLIDSRNSTAHLGSGADDSVEKLLAQFLRLVELLLPLVPHESEDFWGDRHGWVQLRIEAEQGEVEARVGDLLQAASERWQSKMAGQEGSVIDALRNVFVGSYPEIHWRERLEQQTYTCPACATRTVVHGHHEIEVDVDVSVDGGEAYISGGTPYAVFHPGYLFCRACGLELDGSAELAAADISPWDLDIQPEDLFEPDDDNWR